MDRITEAFANPNVITKALIEGVRQAMIQHKQAGKPIDVWEKGKVVQIPPKNIKID